MCDVFKISDKTISPTVCYFNSVSLFRHKANPSISHLKSQFFISTKKTKGWGAQSVECEYNNSKCLSLSRHLATDRNRERMWLVVIKHTPEAHDLLKPILQVMTHFRLCRNLFFVMYQHSVLTKLCCQQYTSSKLAMIVQYGSVESYFATWPKPHTIFVLVSSYDRVKMARIRCRSI